MTGSSMYKRFEALAAKKGVTNYRVAKDIGFSPVLFTLWKTGKSTPKFDKMYKIAKYFQVPMEYFAE